MEICPAGFNSGTMTRQSVKSGPDFPIRYSLKGSIKKPKECPGSIGNNKQQGTTKQRKQNSGTTNKTKTTETTKTTKHRNNNKAAKPTEWIK